MPLVTQNAALTFAHGWVEAWNRHDLDSVLHLLTPDVEFLSPYIIALAGKACGCLRGRAAIRRYCEMGLARIPDLHFRLLDVLAGVDSLTIYYAGHRGPVAETFYLDGNEKAFRAVACYSVSPTENGGEQHG